jgi:hypothetical protein
VSRGISISLRGGSGERAGERAFEFLKNLISPAFSSFLRQEEREQAPRSVPVLCNLDALIYFATSLVLILVVRKVQQ